MEYNEKALLGIPITALTAKEAANKIMELFDRFKNKRQPFYVSTVNTEFLANAHSWSGLLPQNKELMEALRSSSIATADGMPLVALSYFLGAKLPQRVTGADLFLLLLPLLAEQKRKVFFLGGEPAVVATAVQKMKREFPGIEVVGIATPLIALDSEDDLHLVEEINRAQPDLLFLSLGNPKQEIWFARVKNTLHVPVTIGIGGTLSFYTGRLSRAPHWMQRIGLEWMYRLVQEPKRLWRRYIVAGAKFLWMALPLIVGDALHRMLTFKKPHLLARFDQSTGHLYLPTHLTGKGCKDVEERLQDAKGHELLVIDFSKVKRIELDGMALLLRLWQRLKSEGVRFHGVGASFSIRFLLALHRCWDALAKEMELRRRK